jgi:hypothetical protein
MATTETAFPKYWNFDEHGLELVGEYVRTDEGPTSYGQRAIIILDVEGEERALWLTQTALVNQFADELTRRRARDFEPGERITVTRAAEKKTSASGNDYWPFRVTFHDAPHRDAAAILGANVSADTTPTDEPDTFAPSPDNADGDIPF